jgi:ribosome biogenesis GTPase / thiamine phosphate phosphatase
MQVMSAQANFVRIKVDRLDGSDDPPPQDRLLCVVRALLKKIKQQVMVGDHVKLVGIDWVDGRGTTS